jgi:hypothetical protein
MLNPEEAKACIQFLDRCPVTGHQERYAMNTLVNKLAYIVEPPAKPDTPPNPSKEQWEGSADAASGD